MQYAFLVFTLLGALFAFIGVYIEASQRIELLSQHSKKKSYVRPALAQFSARNLICMGAVAFVISIVSFILVSFLQNRYLFYCLVGLILLDIFYFSFKIALGVKRFEEKEP